MGRKWRIRTVVNGRTDSTKMADKLNVFYLNVYITKLKIARKGKNEQ